MKELKLNKGDKAVLASVILLQFVLVVLKAVGWFHVPWILVLLPIELVLAMTALILAMIILVLMIAIYRILFED